MASKKKKYPAPSKKAEFIFYWDILVDEVASRTNFKPGHLLQLKTLCDLYVQKDELDEVLELEGLTYTGGSPKTGYYEKPRPEAIQRNRVVADILAYTKILGLLLFKDTGDAPTKNEEEDWD